MTHRPLHVLSLLALISLPALLAAQESSGKEDERMQALEERNLREEEAQWFGPRNHVTIGFRFLTSGGKVDFGNLGAVPAKEVAPASAGNVDRRYDDGYVLGDAARADERDASGNVTSTPGGRYAVYATASDGTKTQTGEYRAYTPGETRNWNEYTAAQLAKPGYVGFTTYSTASEGGHATDKPGGSAGVELQFSHDIGRLSRRIEWGFTTGIALNGINSKASGVVTSTLNSRTDYFAIPSGATLTAPASGPTYNTFFGPDGAIVNPLGFETTVPLSQTPDTTLTTTKSVAGGAQVNGRWQMRGAYFLVKFGPSFRTQFNDRLELSGSVGFAGAYAGTTYTATESFQVADIPADSAGLLDPQSSSAAKFLKGFYADLTFEYAANDTTGLFGGVTAQQLDAYEQKVADRTARVDLGSTVGIRGGISIKF